MRIINSEFICSAFFYRQLETSNLAEIAFIGKSNVGKSSLINTLLNRKNLAQISKKPGKTRSINLYKIEYFNSVKNRNNMIFADLPGYGYAKVSANEKSSWKILVESYLQNRTNLCGVVIIVDIRHSLNEKDVQAIELIKSYEKPFLLIATKCDKLSKSKISQSLNSLKQSCLANKNVQIIKFSSKNSLGKNDVINWINGRIKC
ncbi:MAG: YihA family ribosome biogenesis GTP-binding protein [Candidatus Cloacimonetes bacterium]|nr:YihA family ribosome biogenesis GTP-binding protein [Candidatus Cloacimonadota bacterium]MBL7107803.1 YihA family ribosome biogenesis GTP-binding protein [Candidatus Cloacimonadota bacterium]